MHEQKKKITKKKRNQEKKIIKDGYITRTSDLFATFERRVSGTANSFASMAKERGGGGGAAEGRRRRRGERGAEARGSFESISGFRRLADEQLISSSIDR